MGRAHCWAAEAMATTEEKALLQRQGGDDGARNAVQKERDDAIRDMASSRVVSEFCWERGGERSSERCLCWCAVSVGGRRRQRVLKQI
jgi:hypothetical protein